MLPQSFPPCRHPTRMALFRFFFFYFFIFVPGRNPNWNCQSLRTPPTRIDAAGPEQPTHGLPRSSHLRHLFLPVSSRLCCTFYR